VKYVLDGNSTNMGQPDGWLGEAYSATKLSFLFPAALRVISASSSRQGAKISEALRKL
jgi:hypothetical protein